MNKTAIKNFAIWARNKLIADISYRAGLMGITVDGIHTALSQSTGQTEFYDIGTAEPYAIMGEAIRQRRHLVELIQKKEKDTDYKTAYKYIIEEVAYTWFNRLIAVRFMEVNDYLPSHIRVLSSDTGKLEPDLVTTPFDAELEFTKVEQQTIIDLKNANKLDEVFRLLFIKQCNALNEILPSLFEKTNDYTELLLNQSVIDQDGVVYHLVHDIPEEDFDVERGGQVEIIGWLYQYYNTEPKNEAFAKKGKITKEELPAVTQLFTPDWIVRYMVENSLGRLWVEGHPNDELKAGWKYYLEEAEQEPDVHAKLAEIRAEYAKLNPEDIKIIDPCMGSGHILVYAFDVLMQIYESAGYGQRDAARSILENNLYGIDIDDRAFQMAYFAVMMKARQYNRRILNGEYKPNLYSIQESNVINRDQLMLLGTGLNEVEKNNAITQMNGLLDTFKDAKEYGSILLVDQYDWDLLDRFVSNIEMVGQMSMYTVGLDNTAEKIKQIIDQGKVLVQKYHVATTNPPYMAVSKGNEKLNLYAKSHYPVSKNDLFSVFIEKCQNMIGDTGILSMITQQAFLFTPSFAKFRDTIIRDRIINLVHIGFNSFPELNSKIALGVAFSMFGRQVRRYMTKYIDLNSGYSGSADKEYAFFAEIENGHIACSTDFDNIPNHAITYSFSREMLNDFSFPKIDRLIVSDGQTKTGDNDKYIRNLWEVNRLRVGKNAKWALVAKGGESRKWYGNITDLIDWSASARVHFKKDHVARIAPEYIWFRQGICWNHIATSKGFAARLLENTTLFETASPAALIDDDNTLLYVMAFLNTPITRTMMELINPSVCKNIGDVAGLPLVEMSNEEMEYICSLSSKCIDISRDDWNDSEISWEFRNNPLVKYKTQLVKEAYLLWEKECAYRYRTLKQYEEEINKCFIEKYSLEKELSNAINPNEITIHLADMKDGIKSILSYAVGCMFGRYSLKTEGVTYAGGDWKVEEYGTFQPDEDNIVPITDENYLEDDIVSRLCTFLKVAFGEGTLEENLDYIARALDNKGDSSREVIRNYFLNNFFKDHCQTYSVTGSGKRPIYWLFDSGKQNGFKALIYLHRYNADTIGNLRIDYLHRMQRVYESEISRMQDMIDHSTNAREVGQATKRRDKLTKQLKECREYDEKLAHLALSRIELDLDDGVKVNYRKLQTANDGKFYEVLADSKNIMAKK